MWLYTVPAAPHLDKASLCIHKKNRRLYGEVIGGRLQRGLDDRHRVILEDGKHLRGAVDEGSERADELWRTLAEELVEAALIPAIIERVVQQFRDGWPFLLRGHFVSCSDNSFSCIHVCFLLGKIKSA